MLATFLHLWKVVKPYHDTIISFDDTPVHVEITYEHESCFSQILVLIGYNDMINIPHFLSKKEFPLWVLMCSDSGTDQLSDVLCIALGVSRCLYHYTTCRTMMLQKWLVCFYFCFVLFIFWFFQVENELRCASLRSAH